MILHQQGGPTSNFVQEGSWFISIAWHLPAIGEGIFSADAIGNAAPFAKNDLELIRFNTVPSPSGDTLRADSAVVKPRLDEHAQEYRRRKNEQGTFEGGEPTLHRASLVTIN